jgi:hypothetical protein
MIVPEPDRTARHGERGSALIIAILVMVILTLLGVAFLVMAETENRIAENQRLAAQSLYSAETGARLISRWFNLPNAYNVALATNEMGWDLDVIDRTARVIDPRYDTLVSSTALYKEGNLNAATKDKLFDRPYGGSAEDSFLGTEEGPDVRIVRTEDPSDDVTAFLDAVSEKLFDDYPNAAVGIRARLMSIEIYGPPLIDVGGNWIRYGVATAKVTAGIFRDETLLSQSVVRVVLNQIPYSGPFGPLHSCDMINVGGNFNVHWGAATAVGDVSLSNLISAERIHPSLPRVPRDNAAQDKLWGAGTDKTDYDAYMAELEGKPVQDPWFAFLVNGEFTDTSVPAGDQPFEFTWTAGEPTNVNNFWPDTKTANPRSPNYSNLFQNQTVSCPSFPYEIWRAIAEAGGQGVYFFVPDPATKGSKETRFLENGAGPSLTFVDAVRDKKGVLFFDTWDGQPPADDYSNLTEPIDISSAAGAGWNMTGFVYLNALRFSTSGSGSIGKAVELRPPGEPKVDGSTFVNLEVKQPGANKPAYETEFIVRNTEAGATWDGRLDKVTEQSILMHGIFYTSGEWGATGNASFYGSVITKKGVDTTAAGTAHVYWDQSIKDDWPPEDMELPRVVITRWETNR